MVSNIETRKLKLFARSDDFAGSVDAVTVLAFISAAGITVSEKKTRPDEE